MNFYGEPTFEHPLLPDFLAEFVEASNKEAVAHNAIVEKEWADAAALVALCYVERNGVWEPVTPPSSTLSPSQVIAASSAVNNMVIA